MQDESGFTLVEAIIAIVLLGIIAVVLMRMPISGQDQFRDNVAAHLADEYVEVARSTPFANLDGQNDNVTINTRGQNVTYARRMTVVGYDIGTVNNGSTYQLNSILTNPKNSNPDFDTSQVKQVTITVSVGGNELERRTIVIAQ